jgi:hypothetical protein
VQKKSTMPTLKAFANSSPSGLFQPWVQKESTMPNAESVRKFQPRVVPTLGAKEKHHAQR